MNDAANASGAPLVLGSPVSELTEHWSGAAYVPGDWRETTSFYRADRERVLCIGKQVWERDDAHPVGLGMFYSLLTQALFPGEGNEGKVTDLAPHGDAHTMHLPPLAVEAALAGRDDIRVDYLPDPGALARRMLDLLAGQRVLGLIQGASEFGPRALGHRSILADPRRAAMGDWINARVKGREWFRPLAAAVLEERAAAWFDLPSPSPFMQFTAPLRASAVPQVAAVTHVDGTARLQTVGADDDPLLRRLLAGFEARTGVPILLNTPFNGKDEPIVETPSEALAAFCRMPLHALALPPFLVTKRSEPELPA
ncbi:carbamoyltransferase C-terminal domain-containing protein [Massilia forsythiae]|nr:carbamoyltransferase C-terminal domain-containing protein [Massilia forsythiae]